MGIVFEKVSVQLGQQHAFWYDTEVTCSERGCQQWINAGSESFWCGGREGDAIHVGTPKVAEPLRS